MKILQVINRCSVANGAAVVIQSMVPTLIASGHQVDVLGLVDVTPSCADRFVEMGCGYRALMNEGRSLYSPSLLCKLARVMKDYDVVHAHLFPSFYWVALVKVFCGYKGRLVFTEHNTQNNRQKAVFRLIERFIYRRYDNIIAISDAVALSQKAHLKRDYGVTVISNGIDIASFESQEPVSRLELGVPADAVMITQVARFGPEKDQMTVLRVLKDLPQSYHAVFVGGGSLLERHREAAAELGISDRVHFLGIRRDVAAILKASDIVVMSSHFDGFGLGAIEGMAAGKPVVASDVPGMREVVRGAGILFNDDKSLAESVVALSTDSRLYEDTVEKCRDRALEYSAEKMAGKYEAIYSDGKI